MSLCAASGDISKEYVKEPFGSHFEYVEVLMALDVVHSGEMRRKERGGRTAYEILRSGASKKHYLHLQNGALYRSLLSRNVLNLLPVGTTAVILRQTESPERPT